MGLSDYLIGELDIDLSDHLKGELDMGLSDYLQSQGNRITNQKNHYFQGLLEIFTQGLNL